MKQDIKLGAYGWRHDSWMATFYPEDLPVGADDDWRLAYYSNEFDCVLVPASYWNSAHEIDCEAWLDGVHEDFKFIVELNESMLEHISLSELAAHLQVLQPQLSALVVLSNDLSNDKPAHIDLASNFVELSDSLEVDSYSAIDDSSLATNKVLKPVWQLDNHCASDFAYIKNNLLDLRLARTQVEDFMAQHSRDKSSKGKFSKDKPSKDKHLKEEGDDSSISLIISHHELQADDLKKFRSVLQIMGH